MSCNKCNTIEKIDETFKVCSRCKKTKYCSKTCQTEDWKIHKDLCKQCTKHDTYFCKDDGCRFEMMTFALGSMNNQGFLTEKAPWVMSDEVGFRPSYHYNDDYITIPFNPSAEGLSFTDFDKK